MIVYAPLRGVRRWIEEELAGEHYEVVVVATFAEAAEILRDADAQRHLFVVDIDSLLPDDLVEIQRAREHGWSGKLIVLGDVPRELPRGVRITYSISRPFGSESLRVHVSEVVHHRDTVKLVKLSG